MGRGASRCWPLVPEASLPRNHPAARRREVAEPPLYSFLTVDALDDPLQHEIDNVMGALRADSRDLRVFFPVLAAKLADALPDAVELEREGPLFARRRPVRRITVRLDDDILEAELTRDGLICRELRLLNGMSVEIEFDVWMRLLISALREKAKTTGEASAALRSLLT